MFRSVLIGLGSITLIALGIIGFRQWDQLDWPEIAMPDMAAWFQKSEPPPAPQYVTEEQMLARIKQERSAILGEFQRDLEELKAFLVVQNDSIRGMNQRTFKDQQATIDALTKRVAELSAGGKSLGAAPATTPPPTPRPSPAPPSVEAPKPPPGYRIGVSIKSAMDPILGPVVQVESVIPGSPAEKGGIESGDIITAISLKEVKTTNDVVRLINEGVNYGEKDILFLIQRQGKSIFKTASPVYVD